MTVNTCATKLTVNGPVMTNNLYLWRSAGAGTGTDSANPAEVFNLRPDAYLWGLNEASKTSQLKTTYERELPPRF